MKRIKNAKNQDAKTNIVKAAMYSFTGIMIYRKWNKKQKRFERKRYQIIPIDCGISRANNKVLYAEDYRDNKQIKMFIIKQIENFQETKRKVKPSFPIKLDNLKRMFGEITQEEV